MLKFLKKHLFTLVMVAGFGLYVYVAGTTGSCAACSAVTGMVGLNPDSHEAAQTVPGDPPSAE
jgi:hypothetical protein